MITKPAVAVAALLLSCIAVPAEAAPWPTGSTSAGHCVTLVATERTALRRPRDTDPPVATTTSPVVRWVKKGERLRSCTTALGRRTYTQCGRRGHDWHVVQDGPHGRGGQIPTTCARHA